MFIFPFLQEFQFFLCFPIRWIVYFRSHLIFFAVENRRKEWLRPWFTISPVGLRWAVLLTRRASQRQEPATYLPPIQDCAIRLVFRLLDAVRYLKKAQTSLRLVSPQWSGPGFHFDKLCSLCVCEVLCLYLRASFNSAMPFHLFDEVLFVLQILRDKRL